MSKNEIIKPFKANIDNGLTVVGDTYKAPSGFVYASGFREFGSLTIVEDVATGTAVSYLTAVKVFDKDGNLIIDKRLKKSNFYERELARKIVMTELLNMLSSQNNSDFDIKSTKAKINNLLIDAYYKTSYEAINRWAHEIGIF